MKEKVKLLIVPLFHAVAVQSLYLDERYNEDSDFNTGFEASNGFEIMKDSSLEIDDGSLSLYHDDDYTQDCIAVHQFENDEERDKWIEDARVALTEWSEKWEGFKTEPTPGELSPGTGDKINIHV